MLTTKRKPANGWARLRDLCRRLVCRCGPCRPTHRRRSSAICLREWSDSLIGYGAARLPPLVVMLSAAKHLVPGIGFFAPLRMTYHPLRSA